MKQKSLLKVPIAGPKNGCCNLCGVAGELTEDHVPPQSVTPVKRRDLSRIVDRLGAKPAKSRHLQNGVKFRTLCPRCNNELLGGRYDPELQRLCERLTVPLRVVARQLLYIPPVFTELVRPNLVAKAIVGHLLAAELREDMSSAPVSAPFPDRMREYFLDPAALLPDEIEFFWWPYPSEVQVIAQAINAVRVMESGAHQIFASLKFFPVGFLITFQRPPGAEMGLPRLVSDRSAVADTPQAVEFDFRRGLPRIDWPEHPEDDGQTVYLLHSEHALMSLPAGADPRRPRGGVQ